MAFTPTIPSASGNPFVSVTTLPEGSLFIIFGSILLGIFVIILLWRVWALWAAHRAATNNEARFTAVDREYGGPFVDPVAELDEADEKGPRLHPVGVPLNPRSKTKAKKSRPKSQADRVREAQQQGRFFSPTTEVLTHGAALPSGAGSNRVSFLPSGYYNQQQAPSLLSASLPSSADTRPPSQSQSQLQMPAHNPPRLSVQHTGRSSMMQHATMSTDTLHTAGYAQQQPPQAAAAQARAKKLRPPSAYLDDLIGR